MAPPAPNLQQQRIIDTLDGALLVLAPVGTGKTRVLAERSLHAIQEGVPAQRILCLTFTNRAAEQMRERVMQYDADAARQATMRTFHSICAYILRVEARAIGLPADFVIYDDVDSAEMVAEIFQTGRFDSRDTKRIVGRIADCKIRAQLDGGRSEPNWQRIFAPMVGAWHVNSGDRRAILYQDMLEQQHALDFADLILYARLALKRFPEARQRWTQRFDFIQVDEVQDTHLSEYEIVRALAQHSRSVALIGDIDQTIYGWRGSEPRRVIDQYARDFQPQQLDLTWNYRATRTLLKAADSFAESFQQRTTAIEPSPNCALGEPIQVHRARDTRQEAHWIAQQIQRLSGGAPNYPYHSIAVLSRTNQRATTVAYVLESMSIPCITVDAFEFFRRQEIKDALACLRLVTNPNDKYAASRMLLRPSRGIGPVTLSRIHDEGTLCGLRLTDMLKVETIVHQDPFAPLIAAYEQGEIVVFDVETTGLAVGDDEVVEVAAVRLRAGKPVACFHEYLRARKPVGDSQAIHGHSDAFLAAHGLPAREVLADFLAFSQGAHLVGHNVGFDIAILAAQARQLDLNVDLEAWTDTWDIAQRFVEAENYRLETLAQVLGLDVAPTHKAPDDVAATVKLLDALMPNVKERAQQRRRIVSELGRPFYPLAQQVAEWRHAMVVTRPPDLLASILTDSGLGTFYASDPKRRGHLAELIDLFDQRDPIKLHPETALRVLLEYAALAKNVDLLSEKDNMVVVITIHQAKGLEFDTVFIAGARENEIPSYYSVQNGDIEEERRVFYVAMTRAKERLLISSHELNERGYYDPESRFVGEIDPSLIVRTSIDSSTLGLIR